MCYATFRSELSGTQFILLEFKRQYLDQPLSDFPAFLFLRVSKRRLVSSSIELSAYAYTVRESGGVLSSATPII